MNVHIAEPEQALQRGRADGAGLEPAGGRGGGLDLLLNLWARPVGRLLDGVGASGVRVGVMQCRERATVATGTNANANANARPHGSPGADVHEG